MTFEGSERRVDGIVISFGVWQWQWQWQWQWVELGANDMEYKVDKSGCYCEACN